jgi:hypothetical protein
MPTFGAYSESWQYKSLILLIQAAIHSPELSDDDSLTSQTFVPRPSILVPMQTSFVPLVEARLEEPKVYDRPEATPTIALLTNNAASLANHVEVFPIRA